ncbi:MAG TPA: hypothetical protein VGB63_16120 [Pedobacter sp.]|jgi:hypothetical protein
MPQLNYLIKGDDRQLRKQLKELANIANKDLKFATGGLAIETEKGNRKIKESIALVNKETDAYRKRNQEAAKLPVQRRKVDMGNSAKEVAAYQNSKSGNITSGNVAGPAAALGAQANAATTATTAQAKLTTATQATTVANKAQSLSIEEMMAKLLLLQEQQLLTNDPAKRAAYNKQIQQTTIEIDRMGNVGKDGFDKMGNAIKGSTNVAGKLWGGLKTVANILPGLGIAGLLAFAVGPLIELIGKLDIFNGKLSESATRLKSINEINAAASQSAGSEIANLKILYKTATDVSIADKKRVEAAKELQKQFSIAFKN